MGGRGGAFDSHAQTAKVFYICMPGFEQAFLQGFDHKKVSAVLGIHPGLCKEKGQYQRCSLAVVTNDWCIPFG